jgi:predicted GNAT family acetyltransferase
MIGSVPLRVTTDADEFASRAEAFLAAEIERNMLATVLHTARTRGGFGGGAPLFALLSAAGTGEPVAAAVRTPPWQMLATGFDTGDQADRLIEQWLPLDPDLPGVSATPGTARAIVHAYEAFTGGASELESEEAMFSLSRVSDPPRPAAGALRKAAATDRDLLIRWELAFAADVQHVRDPAAAATNVDRRLDAGFQYVWTRLDGTQVATVSHNQPIARAARIGPVYTPPEHRRNGYAASATAALSRLLLCGHATGVPLDRCLLFTQLSNPTSNKIYQEIGYIRFSDWERHQFHRPDRKMPD